MIPKATGGPSPRHARPCADGYPGSYLPISRPEHGRQLHGRAVRGTRACGGHGQPSWSQCWTNARSRLANRPGSTRWTKCPSPAHSSVWVSGRRLSRSPSPSVARPSEHSEARDLDPGCLVVDPGLQLGRLGTQHLRAEADDLRAVMHPRGRTSRPRRVDRHLQVFPIPSCFFISHSCLYAPSRRTARPVRVQRQSCDRLVAGGQLAGVSGAIYARMSRRRSFSHAEMGQAGALPG